MRFPKSSTTHLVQIAIGIFFLGQLIACTSGNENPPNILFAIADDWSWPHASVAGTNELYTPAFDRIANEGVLFTNAYCSAPSCTPSRGAILTGQYHWRLEEGANLWSTLQIKFKSYPELLEEKGYFIGYTGKGWGPGIIEKGGRTRNPAGKAFNEIKIDSPEHINRVNYAENFKSFLSGKNKNEPFCFWYGGVEPHRAYKNGIGKESGKNPDNVDVPASFPDNKVVRNDILDYYTEIEWFDHHLKDMISVLEEMGELDNTIIICTSDNGMPFPRSKSNLYDLGTRMPLAIRWGEKVKGKRIIDDFVSLTDLAPTILEATGIEIPAEVTGKSLIKILYSEKSGKLEPKRDHVLTGKERHAWVRKGGLGYPMRAIRNMEFLYILNFEPDRWPAGDSTNFEFLSPSQIYGDDDASPTKKVLLDNQNSPLYNKLYNLSYGKRPNEELYDLRNDPDQLNNVAYKSDYLSIKNKLNKQLLKELLESEDPRVTSNGEIFDRYPYHKNKFTPRMFYDSLDIYYAQGTMAGEISSSEVILQTRLTSSPLETGTVVPGKEGIARFEIDESPAFDNPLRSSWILVQAENDFIVKAKLGDLEPGTQYFYRTEFGITGTYTKFGDTQSFTTLPGKNSEKSVSFVIVTGINYAKFHYGKNGTKLNPGENMYSGPDKSLGYPALESITKLKPDYFIGTGDNVYYDHPKVPRAETRNEMRQKWHHQFQQSRFVELFKNIGTYWEKDDHDYRFNDCDTTGQEKPKHELGKSIFLEQVPIIDPKEKSPVTYRTFRMNNNVQIWFTENRDYRSPNDSPDGPNKSIWGKSQFEWLKSTLLKSDAKYKILVSPTPLIGPDDAYKSDNHVNQKGFRYERDLFFKWLTENGFNSNNFLILCGDRHWQYHSIDPSGFEEFSCGALVDANSRSGRLPGDPESTDPGSTIIQPFVQKEGSESGGFLHVESSMNKELLGLKLTFYDEKGKELYTVGK